MDFIEADNNDNYYKIIQFLFDKFLYSPLFGIKMRTNLEKLLLKNNFKIIQNEKFSIFFSIFKNFYIKGIATK
jgi:hypothetical protein